jgi:hypothetical protein
MLAGDHLFVNPTLGRWAATFQHRRRSKHHLGSAVQRSTTPDPGQIRVGLSGWHYPPWRGVFYPVGLPQRRELEYASRHFATIEINGSFYPLQRPEFYARWRDETAPNFVFTGTATSHSSVGLGA